MTTILFAHDGYISRNGKSIYSSVYNNEIIERYRSIADNVIFLVREQLFKEEHLKNNIIDCKHIRLYSVENFKTLKGITKVSKMYKKIEDLVMTVDYVVARIPSDLGFLAAKYAQKHHIPYMFEVVGCPWDSLRNHSRLGKCLSPFYYFKQKKAIFSAPFALYVTNEFLQKRYPTKGITVGCSDVELPVLDKNILTNRIQKISKKDICHLKLGTLGAVNMKYKGYDTVIKAISKLNQEGYYQIHYNIAGFGDTTWVKGIIEKYDAHKFVTITPPMPHEEIFSWLDDIDIYIQPSKTEGMPRALIEAMSRACPCIGSDAGGIPELLDTSLVFPRGNDERLHFIIKNISKELLVKSATENFNKSSDYQKTILNLKRLKFYDLFKGGK